MKHYMKQNKLLFSLTVITSAAGSLGYVGIALLLQRLLDIAVTKNAGEFADMVLFSLGYFVLLGAFLYLQALFCKKIIYKIMRQMRLDVFQGVLNRDFAEFGRKKTADYISAIVNDVKIVEDSFLIPFFEVVQYGIIFASSLGLMIYFDLLVTLCALACIAVLFLVPGLIGRALEKRQTVFSQELSDFTAVLKDILFGFEIIKSYSMQAYILSKFTRNNDSAMSAKYSVDKTAALSEGVSAFLALMAQVAVLFVSAYFIITGRITAGTLLGMVQVSSNLANPLVMIFTNVPKIKSVKPIVSKLEELARRKESSPLGEPVSELKTRIYAKDLSFSYDGREAVLRGIDCVIEKGGKYLFLGKSGCGKSTLIKLLAGYYSRYEGKIFYDNRELGALKKEDVFQMSSIIHQDIRLFDETIYDNICLHEKYPKEALEQAIEESGLSEFVSGLSEGLFYRVGENGANLSGGQKQRIAVARALIRNKPLLILDEATSALDAPTALDIEKRLLKRKDLTLITITHNMKKELLELYDGVFLMDKGRIKKSSVKLVDKETSL